MTTIALSQAKTSTDKVPENFKSALELALESLDGLQGCLELHIITALKLKEIEVLLSGAKAGVKNAAALKCANIISPLTDQTEVGPGASTTGILSKIFSDEQELESLLRSALLCQPGDYPAIKLEVCDGKTRDILSLDLQPRSVITEDEEEEEWELLRRPPGGAGPHQVRGERTVNTAGLCQSLLTGGSLLATPTAALFLSQTEKEDNSRKVSDLHTELTSQARSLVLRSAEPHSPLHLLTPCSHLSRPPTFLISEALTATDLLPFPPPQVEDTGDDEDEEMEESEDTNVRELLGLLPHFSHYDSSFLSREGRQGRAEA